jgi:midasin
MDSLSSQLCDKLNHFGHLLVELGKESDTGKFQWYDGILVEAVTEGGWIVLDNANLCNPSVLDRLNSLLEPEGSLVLHESTNSNGEPRLLKPHPNFRLFLTMDARYGELSRAMRNRAIEVAVEAQNQETFLNCKKSVGIC